MYPITSFMASDAEEVNGAAAADMWSYGCLLAFVGTGLPPYAETVHVRAEAMAEALHAVHADSSAQFVVAHYALIERAASKKESPLARLEEAALPCPDEMHAIATKCVETKPEMRLSATRLLAVLPRADDVFANDHHLAAGPMAEYHAQFVSPGAPGSPDIVRVSQSAVLGSEGSPGSPDMVRV